jgi:hypothetical protein
VEPETSCLLAKARASATMSNEESSWVKVPSRVESVRNPAAASGGTVRPAAATTRTEIDEHRDIGRRARAQVASDEPTELATSASTLTGAPAVTAAAPRTNARHRSSPRSPSSSVLAQLQAADDESGPARGTPRVNGAGNPYSRAAASNACGSRRVAGSACGEGVRQGRSTIAEFSLAAPPPPLTHPCPDERGDEQLAPGSGMRSITRTSARASGGREHR